MFGLEPPVDLGAVRPRFTARIRFPQKYPARRGNRITEHTYCICMWHIKRSVIVHKCRQVLCSITSVHNVCFYCVLVCSRTLVCLCARVFWCACVCVYAFLGALVCICKCSRALACVCRHACALVCCSGSLVLPCVLSRVLLVHPYRQHFSSHGTVKNVCMVKREGLPGTCMCLPCLVHCFVCR